MEKTKVYFTKEITSESLVKIYEKLGIELKERVAVKLHSGEEGNQNYLRPEFVKDIINRVGGTVVECNTAYDGARNTTEKHKKLMTSHGWDKYYKVDIMDSEDDMILDIPNGNVINKDYVGSHLDNYDSMLVLSHFKGHPMGGYGGALKQLSIGVASSSGKAYIHTAGKTTDANKLWDNLPEQAYAGVHVDLNDIKPGDIIVSGYDGVVCHAALYIGDGKLVHALNSNVGIVVTSMYIMPIIDVRRVA